MTTKTTLRKKLKLHDHLFQNEGTPPMEKSSCHIVEVWNSETTRWPVQCSTEWGDRTQYNWHT